MRKTWVCLVVALWGAAVGCTPEAETSSARVLVTLQQGAVEDSVSRVTVTVSGPGMSALETALSKTGNTWGGVIPYLPAGADRTFVAAAFDDSGNKRYEGKATGVTITAGQETLVAILLQQLTPSPTFENAVPTIDSLVASASIVEPLGFITLEAAAHDPDPGDTLNVTWSASAGTFSAPKSLSTTWTAPGATGPVTLTLTVADPRGGVESLQLTVSVEVSTAGSSNVSVTLNSWPRVTRITASPGRVAVGETTTVTATVTDEDGDVPGAYQWTASCDGSWVGANTRTAWFTPSVQPAGDGCGRCSLSVTTQDGRGGQGSGSLSICVGPKTTVRIAPKVLSATQTAYSVSPWGLVTIHVVARDDQGGPLTFSWTASTGMMDKPTSTASSSDLNWLAPDCLAGPTRSTLVATVRNAVGATATATFFVDSGAECPVARWLSAGSMSVDRTDHEAVLLPSGKVLVAGGFSHVNFVEPESTELYDPATGTWALTGSLNTRRQVFTLTVLPSGKVLAVGGWIYNTTTLASAELYDPATGIWTPTASLKTARYGHTATLLNDGRVLVTGGLGGDLVSSELYDPATGTWTSTGNLNTGRRLHTATLLSDGRVLVVGGMKLSDDLATAELYDPATGTWTAAGSLTTARRGHTATQLFDGRVLVVGGAKDGAGNSVASAELYDPKDGSWKPAASLGTGRWGLTSTLLPDGRVLTVGGIYRGADNTNGTNLTSVELYDHFTNTWKSTVTPMRITRRLHTATALPGGRVLVTGGIQNSGISREAELFTP